MEPFQVASKECFTRDQVHGREVVDFLVEFEGRQSLRVDAQVLPEYVEFAHWVFVLGHPPVHDFFGYLLDEGILSAYKTTKLKHRWNGSTLI